MSLESDLGILDGYLEDQDWRSYAACRGRSQNLFFPKTVDMERFAKNVCRECPVAGDCFEYAVETLQAFGIWGGRTGDEVVRERRRRQRQRQRDRLAVGG